MKNYTFENIRAVLYFLAVLALFLGIGDAFTISTQRDMLYESANSHLDREIHLMEALIRESLLKNDYITVQNFLEHWGKEHDNILKLTATAPNGFMLAEFSRPSLSDRTLKKRETIKYDGRELITLELEEDLGPLEKKLDGLIIRNILYTVILASLMGLFLWLTIKRTAIRPIKAMLREINQLNEGLEARVVERTKELIKTNEELEEEIAGHLRSEARLREEMKRAQSYLDVAAVMLLAINTDGTVGLINKRGADILEATVDEIIGKDWFENYIPLDVRDEIRAVFDKIMSGESVLFAYHENEILTAKGNKRTIAWSNTLLTEENGKIMGTLSSGEDITQKLKAEDERRILQSQLLQSQKMESIGKLAGGVAHDFNNLLSAILGYCEIVSGKLPDGHPALRDISIIREAGEKAENLTRQLLAFSRKQVLEVKTVDLNSIIENITRMIDRIIGEDIILQVKLEPSLYPVMADAAQIEQVLMNFAVNGRDAMPAGGTLTIETENIQLDDQYARTREGVVPGPYVMLSVTDTGEGMTKEVRERIFEPFFTTKKMGKGTGLGLATVYGIVKQHKGHLWVYSEPGEGTTFKVYLPAAGELPEAVMAMDEETPIKGTETILIVEDEASIRRLIVDTLDPLGYSILQAPNAEEAIELSDSYQYPIDMLVTDVVMPGMNGREMAEKLLERRPGMKVLYMSGYTENAIVHQGVLQKDVNFMQKPLSPTRLARKIRSILDDKETTV